MAVIDYALIGFVVFAVLLCVLAWIGRDARPVHHYVHSSYLETCSLCNAMWFTRKTNAPDSNARTCPACGTTFSGCHNYKFEPDAEADQEPDSWGGSHYAPSSN